ncbi:MAG: phosphonopyruvate decarboxylase [Chloroflexi bacterium]|nr:phosphonopyruvate decarboxylase [Chloroflexota bacterium]
MIQAHEFLEILADRGFGPYVGVPCSFLKDLINYLVGRPKLEYLAANNEGEAVAIAAGAHLAGRKPVVMFQNSGLGNAISPLTSLTYTYRIPLLLVSTWRGQPGTKDEPQHELMGQITEALFQTIRVAYDFFPQQTSDIAESVERAETHMRRNSLPYALIMRGGSITPYELPSQEPTKARANGTIIGRHFGGARPVLTRRDAIEHVADYVPASTALIATTGLASRELYCYRERPGNLYVVGSMGCASSIGVGIALNQPNRRVVVLDGDGAALMRLEAMVSVGHYCPENLTHVILDNGAYDSTGGQASLADSVRFDDIALACGYATATGLVEPQDLCQAVTSCITTKGPHLIHVRLAHGPHHTVGRPTLSPVEIKERFMAFLSSSEGVS